MLNDPSLADLYKQTSEEYYEGFVAFDDEEFEMQALGTIEEITLAKEKKKTTRR